MKKSLSTILLSAAIIFPTVITQANVPEKDITEVTSPKDIKPYTYCFIILPEIANACNPFDATSRILTQPATIERFLKKDNLKPPFTPDQITVNTIKHDSREIIVWTFPMPSETTIPLYVAFVPEKDHYRYFTLEYSFDKNFELGNYWVLGEQIDRAHSNYGQYPTPKDWKEFAEIIIKRFL